MASGAERLERAVEIVAVRNVSLAYMIDGPLDPRDDEPVVRYLMLTHTDHSSDAGDAWLEFVDTLDEVLQKVMHLIVDEWAFGGIGDLDSDDYLTPLRVRAELSVADTRDSDPRQHSLVV